MSSLPESGPSPRRCTVCFSVRAPVDPSVMPRVLEVFARRGLVPTTWHSAIRDSGREELQIDIEMVGVDTPIAGRLVESLRQLVCVECVLTSEKHYAMSA